MLSYDGVPISLEIWEWIRSGDTKSTRPLRHLKYLLLSRTRMPEYVNTLADNYSNLSVEAIYRLLQDLFDLVTGIGTAPLDLKKTTLDDLIDEYRHGMLPALMNYIKNGRKGQRTPEPFPELDPDFWEKEPVKSEDGSPVHFLSLKFPFFVYYMDSHIEQRIQYVKGLIRKLGGGAPGSEDLRSWNEHPTNLQHINNVVSYVVGKIFRHYSSRDNFILKTKDAIVFDAVSESKPHEMLGICQSDKQFDLRDEDGNPIAIDPYKSWRILYPDYFAEIENAFKDFFKRFRNECVLYFLRDFVGSDFGIVHIPIYDVYVRTMAPRSSSTASSASAAAVTSRSYSRHVPILIHGGQNEILAALKEMYLGYNDTN